MTAPIAAARRARPQATDLDLSQGPALSLPERAPCALHLIRHRDMAREDLRSRMATHLGPGAHSACLDPARDLKERELHGVRWTQYPVVGAPRYAIQGSVSTFCPGDSGGRWSMTSVSELAFRTTRVIVHVPAAWDDAADPFREETLKWLHHANVVAGAFAGQAETVLVDAGGKVLGGLPELSALAAGIAPWIRFAHSYALNFNAMAFRMLDRALEGPDREGYAVFRAASPETSHDASSLFEVLRRSMPHRGGWSPNARSISSPLALQVLYAIRRRGGIRMRMPVGSVEGRPWKYDLVDPGNDGLMWRGTGRYAPPPLMVRDAISAVNALVNFQLLRFGEDVRTVLPSRTGEAFLDLLHPACEDADLMCRWGTFPLGEGDREAMDAWIARTFRKLKVRVNALPGGFAHAPDEDGANAA